MPRDGTPHMLGSAAVQHRCRIALRRQVRSPGPRQPFRCWRKYRVVGRRSVSAFTIWIRPACVMQTRSAAICRCDVTEPLPISGGARQRDGSCPSASSRISAPERCSSAVHIPHGVRQAGCLPPNPHLLPAWSRRDRSGRAFSTRSIHWFEPIAAEIDIGGIRPRSTRSSPRGGSYSAAYRKRVKPEDFCEIVDWRFRSQRWSRGAVTAETARPAPD